MTKLVVIDIKGAPKALTGHLQRIMLEIRPGTFVWKLSNRKTKQIWDEIKNHDCVAICVVEAKTESGFLVASHGDSSRMVCENFGVSLIRFKSFNNKSKVGKVKGSKITV